jgi:formimidoylglutamate deiminase
VINESVKYYRFEALLQQQGWISPAYIGISNSGELKSISDQPPEENAAIEIVHGVALPGFPNAHSHAFQYAMAGMAEKHAPSVADDFWTWREAMYECALAMEPDHVEAVAAMLYAEMLRMGYTHVAEFHYLHHDVNGRPYANVAEIGERLISASVTAGINLTLIPIFYEKGGFGLDAESRQRRFLSRTVDDYFRLLDATRELVSRTDNVRLGFGVHSLRAVSGINIFKTFENGPKDLPFHLHAAEQIKEVDASVGYLKQRPIEWLLDHLPLSDRFHIVHCTHLNDHEVKQLAYTRANVVLCPGTEGNLGDGVFRLTDFANHYGNWSIGTDSHISLNPFEDLRWLDYSQRLLTHKRNTFPDASTVMMNKVVPAGRLAMGIPTSNFFEVGRPFDAIVVKSTVPLFFSARLENLLPTILYTADPSVMEGTIVRGKWIVRNQVHVRAAEIRREFQRCMRELYF